MKARLCMSIFLYLSVACYGGHEKLPKWLLNFNGDTLYIDPASRHCIEKEYERNDDNSTSTYTEYLTYSDYKKEKAKSSCSPKVLLKAYALNNKIFEMDYYSIREHPIFRDTIGVIDSVRIISLDSLKPKTFYSNDSSYINGTIKNISCNKVKYFKSPSWYEGSCYYEPSQVIFAQSLYQLNYSEWRLQGMWDESLTKGELKFKLIEKESSKKGEYLTINKRVNHIYGIISGLVELKKYKNKEGMHCTSIRREERAPGFRITWDDSIVYFEFEDNGTALSNKLLKFNIKWTGKYCFELKLIE